MDEVVEAPQVAVLAVPLLPRRAVLQALALGQHRSLAEVDEPHFGPARVVMDEQEGATDDLRDSRTVQGAQLIMYSMYVSMCIVSGSN